MKNEERKMIDKFDPFTEILYKFSEDNHTSIHFQSEEIRWDDPHFELSWTSPLFPIIRMFFSIMDEHEFHLHICKWDTKGTMIRKDWTTFRDDDMETFLEKLKEAKDWADNEEQP